MSKKSILVMHKVISANVVASINMGITVILMMVLVLVMMLATGLSVWIVTVDSFKEYPMLLLGLGRYDLGGAHARI